MSITTPPTVDYTELDKGQQITLVAQRKLQLEQQYFMLDLRNTAPSPTDPLSDADKQFMEQLAAAINDLAERQRTLKG